MRVWVPMAVVEGRLVMWRQLIAGGLLICVFTAIASAVDQPVRFMGVGDLPGGPFYSVARGVSADGSVVVGDSQSAAGYEAFRWTRSGGIVGLGDLAGGAYSSVANDVSGDGSVVVGNGTSSVSSHAFRWAAQTGMTTIGQLNA